MPISVIAQEDENSIIQVPMRFHRLKELFSGFVSRFEVVEIVVGPVTGPRPSK